MRICTGCRRVLVSGLLSVLLPAAHSIAQVSFDVVISPTEVVNSGKSEVTGALTFVTDANGYTGTSSGGVAYFAISYIAPPLAIDNTSSTGIKLFSSTGLAAATPQITLIENILTDQGCSGRIVIGLQPGVEVGTNEFIRIEGVRGRIDASSGMLPGTPLYADIEPVNDPVAYTFNQSRVRVSRSLDGLTVQISADTLRLCEAPSGKLPGAAPWYSITVAEGFARAFVDADANNDGINANDRVDSSGAALGNPTNSTQFLVRLEQIPGSVSGISWPDIVITDNFTGAQLVLVDAVFEESLRTALATYSFEAGDQTTISDNTLESFRIIPAIILKPDAATQTGLIMASVTLGPAANLPATCTQPNAALARPRFLRAMESDSDSTGDIQDDPRPYANIIQCTNNVPATDDFNGDFKSDILWHHSTTGILYTWFMDGTGSIADGSAGAVSDSDWQIQGKGDFNGDGKADILWRHTGTGQLFIWLMDGLKFLAYQSPGGVPDLGWQIRGIGDFNGDGESDILWRHDITGQLVIWFVNGTTIIGNELIGTVSDLGWRIAAVGDFNGDYKADILWRHSTTGVLHTWFMDGKDLIAAGSPGTVTDPGWEIQGRGDFNGDDRADILWRHTGTGQLFMWLMDGLNFLAYQSPGSVADLGWQIRGIGDFNGDGDSDILWRHDITGELVIWFIDGTSIVSNEFIVTVTPDWTIVK